MELKDTNPKDAVGVRKVPLSTMPCGVMLEVGLAMLEGARKYGRHNYRAIGVRASVYYDAVVGRHIMPWWEGQDNDPDSGLSHITKAIAGLTVLRDSMLSGNWVDDRPIRNTIPLGELNNRAAAIIDKYPDAQEPFTQAWTGSGNREQVGELATMPAVAAELTAWLAETDKMLAEAGVPTGPATCGDCHHIACSLMGMDEHSACRDFVPEGGGQL